MNETSMARSITVDGERWEVRKTGGQYDFRWLSGIAEGYGFTSRLSDPARELSSLEIEDSIRDFMGNVNPETGYLD